VVEDHSVEVQPGRCPDARVGHRAVIVEDGRRRRWFSEVIGEKISGEEEPGVGLQKAVVERFGAQSEGLRFYEKTNDGCFLTRSRCASISPCTYE